MHWDCEHSLGDYSTALERDVAGKYGDDRCEGQDSLLFCPLDRSTPCRGHALQGAGRAEKGIWQRTADQSVIPEHYHGAHLARPTVPHLQRCIY